MAVQVECLSCRQELIMLPQKDSSLHHEMLADCRRTIQLTAGGQYSLAELTS